MTIPGKDLNPEYRTKTELNMYNRGKSAKSPNNL